MPCAACCRSVSCSTVSQVSNRIGSPVAGLIAVCSDGSCLSSATSSFSCANELGLSFSVGSSCEYSSSNVRSAKRRNQTCKIAAACEYDTCVGVGESSSTHDSTEWLVQPCTKDSAVGNSCFEIGLACCTSTDRSACVPGALTSSTSA